MRDFFKFLFGKDLWFSRTGMMILTSFLSLIWFIVDWCSFTTFRAMSDWLLYCNNILAAIILSIPFIVSKKVWLQTAFLTIIDCLFLANIMYCRTYFTAIPPESYALAGNMADFTASIWTSLRYMDLGFPLILIIGTISAYRIKPRVAPRQGARLTLLALILALISGCVIICRGGFYAAYDKLTQSCYYSTCGVPIYTIGGHLAYFALDRANTSSADMHKDISQWLDEHKKLAPYQALPDSVKKRKNLVVIICESFESWPLQSEIGGKAITPYLNSLIADSTTLFVPNTLTQVASGRSIDFQLLLNTGLLPMTGTVYSMKYPSVTYPSMNKALAEKHGSKSIIFTCDKPITWNQEAISRAFGYDSLIDRRAWNIDELVGNPGKLSDGSFLRQSVEKLRKDNIWPNGTPIMLTFVTYSGHSPFVLPDKLKDPSFDVSGTNLPEKLKDYVTMAHYTDSQLHTLIDYLKSRPDYDDTLILITGDHEGLSVLREESRKASKEASALVSEGQFTPIILLNSPVTGRIDKVVGQVDIYPTLLNLLDLDEYNWKGLGCSILSPLHPGIAVSSMTMEMAGDSTNTDAEIIHSISGARRISDAMIRSDYFKK